MQMRRGSLRGLVVVALSMFVLTCRFARAVVIDGDPADADVFLFHGSGNTGTEPTNAGLQVAFNGSGEYVGVFVFQLPARPVGQIVSTADFSSFVYQTISRNGTPGGGDQPPADLYGLGF